MSLQRYQNEEEEVNECLFHTPEVIEEVSERINPVSLCRLLIHRSSGNLLNKPDRETVEGSSSSATERYGTLLDLLKTRTTLHPSLQLLDCLRCTSVGSLPSLPPITCTIVWVTPSSQYAAIVIDTIETMSLLETPLVPHFWPVQHSSSINSASRQGFLYRICNIFTSVHTKLILVFPEDGESQESLSSAVEGSLSQWTSVNLVVYTDLLTATGVANGPVLYRGGGRRGEEYCSDETVDKLRLREGAQIDSWSQYSEMGRECSYYYQMMWLGRLMIEIERERSGSTHSELLNQLGWDTSTDVLTEYQSHVLNTNLPDWKSEELRKYLVNESSYWSRDENNPPLELIMDPCIEETLENIPSSYFTRLPQVPDRCPFVIEESTDRLPEVIRNVTLPTLVTSGVVPAHLITPNFHRLAAQVCCRFTVKCILVQNNN